MASNTRRGWGKMGAAPGAAVSYVPVGSAKASSAPFSSNPKPQATYQPKPSPAKQPSALPAISTAPNPAAATDAPASPACTYRGLEVVISGGETGADKGGLVAAQALGITTGGTAPKGFKTERGPDRNLARFGLVEEPSMGFSDISMMNVEKSDGTIAFRLHEGAGTDRTITYCQARKYVENFNGRRGQSLDTGYRPVLVISSVDESNFDQTVNSIEIFILSNRIRTVNIAGHRESTAGVQNFERKVELILTAAFKNVASASVGANTTALHERIRELNGGTLLPDSKFVRKHPRVSQFVVHSKKQKYDVYVGRPSEWGNPFHIGSDGTREDVCKKFEEYAREDPAFMESVKQHLKGKVLGCFCAPLKCHAETLAQIANFE